MVRPNCRSTAPGAKRTSICLHPGRVLLRRRCKVRFYPRWLGSIVGAPPRCESGGQLFAPGAGAPTAKVQGSILPGWLGPIVGAPPRCEAARQLFAPGAGAPTTKVQGPILPGWLGPIVGAPPRCEADRHLFAPGAGAPTAKVQVRFYRGGWAQL